MLNYQLSPEEQMLQNQQLLFSPNTDFGRVSMGQAPQPEMQQATQQVVASDPAIEQQSGAADIMNSANLDAAGSIGEQVKAQQVADPKGFSYQTQGATDTQALGEGLFAFGLSMLMGSSKPGGSWDQSLGQSLGEGFKMFKAATNRQKRVENIPYLEKQGFTKESIDMYLETGDNRHLIKGDKEENYMDTKVVDGQMYAFDKRDPAGTMKPVATNGQKINKTVDLGDRVIIQYNNGSSEIVSKGMTPGQAAKAEGGGGGRGKGIGDIKVLQLPGENGGLAQTIYVQQNKDGEWFTLSGDYVDPSVMRTPGVKVSSEAEYNKQFEKTSEGRTSEVKSANIAHQNILSAETLLNSGSSFWDPTRMIPGADAHTNEGIFRNAKSVMMVDQYSNMAGVAGASVKTEEALLSSIPEPTATVKQKVEWAKKYNDYTLKVANATIEDLKSRGKEVPGQWYEARDAAEAFKKKLGTYKSTGWGGKAEVEGEGSGSGTKTGKVQPVRAPLRDASNAANNPWAASAMAKEAPKGDFRKLWE